MRVKITGTTDPERKIHAIKGLRAATGLGLRDAKYIIDDVFSGVATVVEVPNLDATNTLREYNLVFELFEPIVKDAVINALARMPLHLTVADVLAVLGAVA